MSDEEGNNIDDDSLSRSPFTRPTFLLSAGVVLLIVVLGLVVAVRVATSSTADDPSVAPASPPGTSAPATPTESTASVCGLPAGTDVDPVTTPPPVTWDYQGTIAYPTSPEFGAAKTSAEGYRYCFQHSRSGAVVMAANALAQGSDPELAEAWTKYVLSDGRYRDQLEDEMSAGTTGAEGSRLKIAGFRVLSYDGKRARIDLGVQGSSQNQTLTVSGVYELVWQDGDWKISADVEHPLDISTITDLSAYVPWGA